MTLSSRHRIRNSNPGGLRPSTLPLGHGGSPQYWLSHVDGKETFFVSFKPPRPGTEPRTLAWKAAVLTTTLGPPPCLGTDISHSEFEFSKPYWFFFQRWIMLENTIPFIHNKVIIRWFQFKHEPSNPAPPRKNISMSYFLYDESNRKSLLSHIKAVIKEPQACNRCLSHNHVGLW